MKKVIEFFHSMFAPNLTSEQFSTNMHDYAKGLFVASLSGAFTLIGQSIEAGVFTFDWKTIAKVSLAGGFSYLIKNFFSTPAK